KTSSEMGLRSTVVAPSRERICMLSWVAMERIYEREVLPDAKLRKQAGARPLRVHAKHLTDGELLAKLCSFGIEMDRTWLERECERALSAQEIAGPLMDQSESRGLESDWIWICVVTLWRRWLPDQPSFEELDDQMQAGYELLKTSGAVAACRIWLEAWHDVLRLLDKAGIESIEEFDDRFRGTQSRRSCANPTPFHRFRPTVRRGDLHPGSVAARPMPPVPGATAADRARFLQPHAGGGGLSRLHPRAPLFVPVLQAHGLAAAAVRFRDFTVSGSPPARWPAEWRRFTDEWLAVAELQAGGAGSGAAAGAGKLP